VREEVRDVLAALAVLITCFARPSAAEVIGLPARGLGPPVAAVAEEARNSDPSIPVSATDPKPPAEFHRN
jgi:hypothetical protein